LLIFTIEKSIRLGMDVEGIGCVIIRGIIKALYWGE
jgi:hypothetical protein